jgi:hypothetical protein
MTQDGPPLDHVDIVPPTTTSGAGFMDYDTGADEPDRGKPGDTGDATTDAGMPARPGPGAPATGDANSARPADGKAGHSSSGAGSEPTPGIEGRGKNPSEQPGQPRGRTPASSETADRVKHRIPHGRLRSYVVTGRDANDAAGDDERPGQAPADTLSVDQAGVSRVVDHERAAGRHPEVMPHENPGFDVLSRHGTGQVLRHIEVKSVSGAWDDMGVGLTRTQFEFAQQHRDTFWLYVVEYALDDERARVLRIADPAGRADEFRFDDGWSAVIENAEPDLADEAHPVA